MSNLKFCITLFLTMVTFSGLIRAENKHIKTTTSYFPMKNDVVMVYKSSFGEVITEYFEDGEFAISSSEADDFKYKQKMIVRDEGIYVTETFQFINVFLFLSTESTITYQEPILRFPLPLLPGVEWMWEGNEYSDGDTNKVTVTGRVYDFEIITTKAGRFETIKLQTIVEGASGSKNSVTEWFADGIGLIRAEIVIEGGGMMGFLRDLLGYGTIEFELAEIRKQ